VERVKTLELYPDQAHLPTDLLYELALNRAEAGDFTRAIELFRNRFFGREEGGTNVRQVWIEVKLQQAVALARSGKCDEAVAEARALGSPVAGLTFTNDGLQPILNSARTHFLMGETFGACGEASEAERHYRIAAQATSAPDVVWAWASAKKTSGFDSAAWQKRLTAASTQAESNARTSSHSSWWWYVTGILQMALAHQEAGNAAVREALLAPDTQMSHHFSRLALAGATPR
jgi:tetratricopeptide (TPR) repeat protein